MCKMRVYDADCTKINAYDPAGKSGKQMRKAHFFILQLLRNYLLLDRVLYEYPIKVPGTSRIRKIDIFAGDGTVFIEVDGPHHFKDTKYGDTALPASTHRHDDISKMIAAFAEHPDCVFIRISSADIDAMLNKKQGDYLDVGSILKFIFVMNGGPTRYSGMALFIERSGSTHYNMHKDALALHYDVLSIGNIPRKYKTGSTFDRRIYEYVLDNTKAENEAATNTMTNYCRPSSYASAPG